LVFIIEKDPKITG